MTASSSRSAPTGSADRRLGELAEELAARLRSGAPLDLDAFLASHPDQAEALRPLLPAIRVMADLGRSAARTVSDPADPVASLGEVGDYQILREVGRGGMGVVYEARQLSLNRRVALKVLPFAAALVPRQLQRFRNEAQAAAGLHHPHVVPVYAVGCERGVHYYAMQFVEGRSLAEAIRDLRRQNDAAPADRSAAAETTGPLSPGSSITGHSFFREVARLGIEAAEALEYAHSLGVVHRDIKPANLLLDSRDHLWVADFGLARFHAEAGLTMTGDVLGTLRYMSPEQALGHRGLVDQRTDVYSLGVTLYELLTLRPALDGRDRQELLRQIAFEEPPAPRRLNPAIPRELETIVLKAIAKEPPDRYATAQELADDLRRFLEHKPIRARRPTLSVRAARWARRNRPIVAAGLSLLVLAVIGLSVGLVLVARERTKAVRQRERAEESFRLARDAVDQMLTEVAQKSLADSPRMERVRLSLLEKALAFNERLLAQRSGDRFARLEVAQAYRRAGEINYLLGHHAQSAEAFRRSIEQFEALIAERPEDARARRLFAETLRSQGDLLNRIGPPQTAERVYRRSIDLLEHLLAEDGGEFDTLSALAMTSNNLGILLYGAGRLGDAEGPLRRSLELNERLAKRTPGDAGIRSGLGATLNNLAGIAISRKAYAEARRLLQRAIVHQQAALQAEPRDHRFRNFLRNHIANLSDVQRNLGDPAASVASSRLALTQGEALVAEFPDVPAYQVGHAEDLANLGLILPHVGRLDEAVEVSRRSLELFQGLARRHPEVPSYKENVAFQQGNYDFIRKQRDRSRPPARPDDATPKSKEDTGRKD